MGLLDDAIREHLELKRLRGADPGEVAREEQEALGSPYDENDAGGLDGYVEDEQQIEPAEASPDLAGALHVDDDHFVAGMPTAGEETVEIDMQTVLERREEHPSAEGDADDPSAEDDSDDVLEETPDFLRETPDQERLWFEQRPPRDFDFNE